MSIFRILYEIIESSFIFIKIRLKLIVFFFKERIVCFFRQHPQLCFFLLKILGYFYNIVPFLNFVLKNIRRVGIFIKYLKQIFLFSYFQWYLMLIFINPKIDFTVCNSSFGMFEYFFILFLLFFIFLNQIYTFPFFVNCFLNFVGNVILITSFSNFENLLKCIFISNRLFSYVF